MKANHQQACLDLGIIVIDKSDNGSLVVYGLPEVKVCDLYSTARDMALESGFTFHEIVATRKVRGKDV